MSEVNDEYDPDEDLEDEELEDESEDTPAAKPATGAFGRSYEDLPEGHVTPVGFVRVLKEQRGVEVRPQVIYSTAKNTKTFPAFRHTDGRIIMNTSDALKWWDEKEERRKTAGTATRSTEPTAWEKAQKAQTAEAS
jgi:hypothetical protein